MASEATARARSTSGGVRGGEGGSSGGASAAGRVGGSGFLSRRLAAGARRSSQGSPGRKKERKSTPRLTRVLVSSSHGEL